jgi:long-chain acyl-CoA synthetase
LVEEFRKHAAETAVVAHRGVRRYATTYGELAELAGRFAAELERRGIKPGERVVLWGADSAEWIGVFFGCLLRGVMVVPLDAAGDAGFAGRVVRDVGARLVVSDREQGIGNSEQKVGNREQGTERQGSLFPDPCSLFPERMELRGIGARLGGEPLWAVSEAVGLDTPFQIVFTSGTTREPRGIVHTHRNVLATLDPIEREMAKYRKYERLFHPLRFLHSLPLSHVFGQFMGLWCPALLAAEVHFAEQLEPARMVELIRRERISVLVAVPRVLELLRGHLARFEVRGSGFEGSSQLSVVSSQKEPMRGSLHSASFTPASKLAGDPDSGSGRDDANTGGALRTENIQLRTVVQKCWRGRRVHRALGWKFWAVISGGATLPRELEEFWSGLGYALIQGYGMTETTALVTLNHPFHIKQGTIGKTLPGREVKIGADGEILVRGDVVAGSVWERGAMRRREGEWLATGDLAEAGAEGELKFVGRKGDVIVTGAGMNVHPADLEAALAGQAGVRGVVVVGCDFAAGPEAVAVVLFAGTEAELAAAVKEANRGLAEYQQIRRWVRWPELRFPYTSTGKLVRREVAAWVCGEQGTGRNREQGTGRYGVVEVIEEVTGEAVAGDGLRLAEDLKLDSLGRVQLQSALEQRFDVELDEDAMAAVETVGELRRMVEGELGGDSHPSEPRPLAGDPDGEHGRAGVGGEKLLVGNAKGMPQGLKPTSSAGSERSEAEASGYLEAKAKAGEEVVYPRWAWWWWVRWVRVAWIEGVMRPLVWVLARPRVRFVTADGANAGLRAECVTGKGTNVGVLRYAQNDKSNGAENDEREHETNAGVPPLASLGRNDGGLGGMPDGPARFGRNDELSGEGPVLVVANHVTAMDGALVLYALPGRIRRRVACAMSGEMLMDYRRGRGQGNWALNVLAPGAWWLLTALFNVFPLPRARGFRRSFAHAGEAMDRGYSVLVFPEGSRSRDGKMHEFRGGIGLLAKEAGAAVVPVGLRGLYDYPSEQSSPGTRYELTGDKRARWFHAGKIEIRVGAVVAADEASDPAEVTRRLEAAVRGLVEES